MTNSQEIILLVVAFVVIGGIYTIGYILHRMLRKKVHNKFLEKYAQHQNTVHPQTETKLSELYDQEQRK